MTTLAVDLPRNFELGTLNELPVIASDIIYEGAAVGDNGSGYMRPLVAGDPFRGFAESNADNSDGDAGDIDVRVRESGKALLTLATVAITDVGKPVYASDDNTFTLTASTNSLIGYVYRYVTSTTAIVAFGNVATATAIKSAGGSVVIPSSTIIAGQLKVSTRTVTVASNATSGTSTADTTLSGGTIIGFYASSDLRTNTGSQAIKAVSIGTSGAVKVLLGAAGNHAATFKVNVLKAS